MLQEDLRRKSDESYAKFCERVRFVRKTKGYNRKNIADAIGISPKRILRIEGTVDCRAMTSVIDYLTFLGLDINDIFKTHREKKYSIKENNEIPLEELLENSVENIVE